MPRIGKLDSLLSPPYNAWHSMNFTKHLTEQKAKHASKRP